MSTSNKALIRLLEKKVKAIGKERDELREIRDNANGLLDCCEQALASLEDTIELLSQQA